MVLMKIFSRIILLVLAFLVGSCGDGKTEPDDDVNKILNSKETVKDTRPLEIRAKDHVMKALSIPEGEKFEINIYRQNLDGDEFEDAIITVNRFEYAVNQAIASGNSAKSAEFGFMGNNNNFFFYDGGLDMISPPKLVPSSAKGKLKIDFKQLSSPVKFDLLVDYNIGNSIYRNVYIIYNHTPIEVYQMPIIDNIGESKQKAYYIDYLGGTYSNVKDIVSFEGKVMNYTNDTDMYDFIPEIKKTGNKVLDAFYNPKDMKYYIRTKGMNLDTLQ